MTIGDIFDFSRALSKQTWLPVPNYLDDRMLRDTKRQNSMTEFWKVFWDTYFSSYSFYFHLASSFSEISSAAAKTLTQDFASSNVADIEKAMNKARDGFDAKFRDPAFVKSLADAVNSYARFARVSGIGQAYQNISNITAIWNNTFAEPLRDQLLRTPAHKIHSESGLVLFHYENDRQPVSEYEESQRSPLLVVYAFINRHYILDLVPEVSIIRNLLKQGCDVYGTDWGTPGAYDKDLTIGHYVDYLDSSVDHIRKHSKFDKVSLLGYCWGGDLALMYASLHPEKVEKVVTLATPGDFDLDNGLLSLWTRNIDADAIVDAFGNAPSMMLNLAFALRSPMDPLYKYPHFFEQPRDLKTIQQFLATETWLYDSPPVIGEIYRQFVNDCYKKNLFIQNKMTISGDQRIDLTNVKMPFLNIIASNDDLVAPESSRALNNVIGSNDKSILEFKSGHVGACISPQAHSELWPKVGEWIRK